MQEFGCGAEGFLLVADCPFFALDLIDCCQHVSAPGDALAGGSSGRASVRCRGVRGVRCHSCVFVGPNASQVRMVWTRPNKFDRATLRGEFGLFQQARVGLFFFS